MSQPLAYLNGSFVPAAQAMLPVYDAGFVQGTTVAEQLRTFGGKLFQVEAHLARLQHSLDIVGVDPGMAISELGDVARELAAKNHALLAPDDDLGLTIFVTPGAYAALAPPGSYRPTVCVHSIPLQFRFWAAKYALGEALVTTNVEQVSTRSWPPELKCRSRMHYYLADRKAREKDPQARAVMLDEEGFVTEATTANILVYSKQRGLQTPPRDKILPGISLATLAELARQLGIPLVERDLKPGDLAAADEILLTSTSPCVLPVVRFEGAPIGAGSPGEVHQQLLCAWSARVDVDIPAQAVRVAGRR